MNTLEANTGIENNFSEISDFISIIKNASDSESFIGSDEYLDFVSRINKKLDFWIKEVGRINEFVESNFPTNKDEAVGLSQALHQLYGGLNISLSLFKGNEVTFKSFESRIEAFEEELEQIQEFILDIQSFVLNRSKDLNELDSLLQDM